MEKYRLDKLLTLSGMSRTEAKRCISQGRVMIDGRIARDPAQKAGLPQVMLDGAPLDGEEEVYLMLNKPAGIVTATRDNHLPTVMTLLPEKYLRRNIGPVGRLDRDVTGLVIMTTDGELAHRLISPKWKADKTYYGECEGRLTEQDVKIFAGGMELSDFTALPAKLEILSATDEHSTAKLTIHEGKFHQVKRMFAAVGHPLTSLSRLRIGCVTLDESLPEGGYRKLNDEEIQGLYQMTGLSKQGES